MNHLTSIGAPSLGRLFYPKYPESIVIEAIRGHPKLVAMDNVLRWNDGSKLIEQAIKVSQGGYGNLVRGEYPWIWHTSITEAETLNEKVTMDMHPFSFLYGDMDKMIRIYDVTQPRGFFKFHPQEILRILRDDKYFPRNFQSEQIFSYISNPIIFRDYTNIMNALIAMGASASAAGRAATYLVEHARGISISQAMQAFSFNDSFVTLLDQSQEAMDRCVRMDQTSDMKADQILRELFHLYSMLSGFKTKRWSVIDVKFTEESNDMINRQMLGRFYDVLSVRFNDVFPSKSHVSYC
jgi:hypothetical protein